MRIVGMLIAGAAGLFVGALGVALAFNLLPLPDARSPLRMARMERLSTQTLGEALLGKVAGGFVADSRAHSPLKHGVAFYDKPTAYGDYLCTVRMYAVSHRVVNGEPMPWGEAMMWVDTAYGIWRDPSDPMTVEPARQQACARYRDFGHLIWGDAANRGAFMMDAARDASRAGKVMFKVSCVNEGARGSPSSCNGLALLREIDLRKISGAHGISRVEESDGKSAIQIDDVRMPLANKDGHPAERIFRITSRQRFGKEDSDGGVILAVDISHEVF
ncbi:MAG TPA: hypothetical protein VEA44_02260 [Caulobacter sp.]|nr:hypothetical protein [Caulobacter sp.]